jgi:Ni/Fe-hydrogenase subunit HybB-like protein
MEKLETVEIGKEKKEGPQIKNLGDFWRFFKNELKPKGKPYTLFNIISAPVMVIGLILIIYRFVVGLGAPVTNLNQSFPWGIWIGFDVICGVAFAAGGYVLAFMVYILGLEKYRPILRVTVLNAFLSYVFYAGAIALDLGRWWNMPNAFLGNRFGVSSVMFIVAWHFMLYMLTLALEVSPAVAEWLNLKKARKILGSLTLGAVVFGVMLSIHHQAGLGALFTMAKAKIHPLWYSEFLPITFFISSIYAGLSMVIFEGTISHKVFTHPHQLGENHHNNHESDVDILVGLSRVCAGVIFAYIMLTITLAQYEGDLHLINTTMGSWWLTEVVGFVIIPGFMFIHGAQFRNTSTIRVAAIIAIVGIILNRFNCVFIAYNWFLPFSEKYHPSVIEVLATLTIIFIEVWTLRWIINRMPILREAPEWVKELKEH